jgi:hypothetical protein
MFPAEFRRFRHAIRQRQTQLFGVLQVVGGNLPFSAIHVL